MAGVDALDKMLSSYRPKMRSKNVVEFIFAFVEYGRSGRVSPANHHPFIAREAICKKPPGATVILTNNPPDIARTLPPIMCPRTMCKINLYYPQCDVKYETFNIGLLGKSLSPNAECQKNWFVKIEALTQGEPNSTSRQLIKCVINEKHSN
ncbi:hypothetical protein T05_3500 [Trichinella murrelli]|uniref:Uncharacterized protein n=1 Tax=Trichinella murrelli TaxID=144512 RepID=A0A0V0TT59_9BILA|nr:hypothetical protein T05_3500 [Trichinella murrelli]